MRILHTSDWHVGQHCMGKSRQAEHQALIAWLLEQVDAQAVDAVLVASDIFDTGTPPSYARKLYNLLVVCLNKAGAALLLLGGNHDSLATLSESREPLAHNGDNRHRRSATANPAASSAPFPSSARATCCKARPGKVPKTSSCRCKRPSRNITAPCSQPPS
jgi:DNA repair exonuclease SbcCD nuclease subunit